MINAGVNGERTDEIAARFDRDVLAHAPDVLILLAGVNDVYQGREAHVVQAQLLAMYTRAGEARLRIVACSIIPFDTATPDQNARMHAINAWIRDTAVVDARHGVLRHPRGRSQAWRHRPPVRDA